MKYALIGFVQVYQKFISRFKPASCIFRPSCSNYFIGAVERHGIAKGTRLGLKRILRCRYGNPGGYDPVPE